MILQPKLRYHSTKCECIGAEDLHHAIYLRILEQPSQADMNAQYHHTLSVGTKPEKEGTRLTAVNHVERRSYVQEEVN